MMEDRGPEIKNSPFEPSRGESDGESGTRGVSDEQSKVKMEENPHSRGGGIAEGDGRCVSGKDLNPTFIFNDIEDNLQKIHEHSPELF